MSISNRNPEFDGYSSYVLLFKRFLTVLAVPIALVAGLIVLFVFRLRRRKPWTRVAWAFSGIVALALSASVWLNWGTVPKPFWVNAQFYVLCISAVAGATLLLLQKASLPPSL